MANTSQDTLYETFLVLAADLGQQTQLPLIEASQEIDKSAANMAKAVESAGDTWNRITPVPVDTVTPAGAGKTATAAENGGSIASTVLNTVFGSIPLAGAVLSDKGPSSAGSTIETIASTVLKSGFGVIPLVGSLLGLFGGGAPEAPSPLVKYALPPSLEFQGAQGDFGLGNSDYDQMGMPRLYAPVASERRAAQTDSSGTPTGPAPQITVNVNAMDARSFLDRSSDIAAAVRDAMLNLNSINDVVNDL